MVFVPTVSRFYSVDDEEDSQHFEEAEAFEASYNFRSSKPSVSCYFLSSLSLRVTPRVSLYVPVNLLAAHHTSCRF